MSNNKMSVKKIKGLIKKDLKEFNSKSKEEIDKEFVEQFGQDALEELEFSYRLRWLIIFLSKDMDITPVFVTFEDMKEDSKLCMGDELTGPFIIVNRKLMRNEMDVIKCVIHETRHYYHYQVIENDLPHPLRQVWIEDLQNNSLTHPEDDEELAKHICLPIEVDALAYTKYIVKLFFNEDIVYGGEDYNDILDQYVEKYIM